MQKLIFTSSNKPLTKNKIQDSDEFGHEPSETEKLRVTHRFGNQILNDYY